MISLEEARRIIAQAVPKLGTVAVPLAEARGRLLAEDVRADAWYPSGDRATMDGYVLRADAEPGEFKITGEIQAGAVPTEDLAAGEAMRIFTGALVPESGGRVVPQEMTVRDGEIVRIAELPKNPFIRLKGQEATPGTAVVVEGTRLGATELAMLAQVGEVMPMVTRLPVIRHVATGEELVGPEEKPSAGMIRDTNSTLLAALVAANGGASLQSFRCGDDPAAMATICAEPCDLLLISGGASVGDYDFGARVLRDLGFEIHFGKVNLRPGKPLTFATRNGQAAFVIPGNPVSHFVCFHVAIRLALELMAGEERPWELVDLPLAGGEPVKPDARETFWPARVEMEAGRLVVRPQRWSTSGDTFSLLRTNALVLVNQASPVEGVAKTLLLTAL
ncbi:molybdopterin molybdotransferase MoeA [Luteolibacter sp. GHJ8]|uniref:Molybdopterin molybdenumtransferase n=1 Tax=Luteolibacter rhizosphaerae TaxID=2989719 RepID=A0ABT3FXL4_9BACT|nr:molybdopterin molybdotransferase MoeA [Luteolibacter rhizosphaerae]MCW1911999.1 molybdopterin molybdotransferase MoeA [Luteolibacter rhizosphaerae]